MSGTTPPLIMIPGMQCTAAMFAPLQAELQRTLPGTRISTHVAGESSLTAAVASLARSITEPAVLVGHSLGGTVAMATARAHPELVAGMALLCSNPNPPRLDQQQLWHEETEAATHGLVEERVNGIVERLVGGERFLSPNELASVTGICRAMVTETGPQGLINQLGIQKSRVDERPGLREFEGPVLSVVAAEDQLIPLPIATETAFYARKGRNEVIHGVSHMAPLTTPEKVASQLTRWLQESFRDHQLTPSPSRTEKVAL
ncbi:Putative aminoacrylate hydrolase RutD [Arthrobacter ulcerisalmonis]|uniref:Aminoacrylate hydrolase RutD n=1 Tax=Arthrobacter ulcerisalmonis TaxID=2483813 RepID=A0A3P5WR79_9MICC|nr:Putative aminoacrylate hydrolase RutD [Arthrobacter ulcerisalmonis]